MRNKKIDWIRILALLVVLIGILYFYCNIFAPKLIPPLLRLGVPKEKTNILILGTDTLYYKTTGKPIPNVGNSDSIILLNINPNKRKINIVSIPRDTLVKIKGFGWHKINAAYPFGGPDLAIKTVQEFLQIPVHNYINVEIHNIPKLIDLLGGVYVFVDKDMYYVDHAGGLNIDLKKGWQKLGGKEAHNFIRFRHDPEGDIMRIRRQQHLAQKVIESLKSPAGFFKLPFMLQTIFESIKTDLNPLETIKILNLLRMAGAENVEFYTIPGDPINDPGLGSILNPNYKEMEAILEKIR